MRYFDTGVLLKLYLHEPNSPLAIQLIREAGANIPLLPLHRLEMIAVLANHVGRGMITETECNRSIANFEADVAGGIFEERAGDLRAAFSQAEKLARIHGAATLCRSLDVLHVAMAQAIGVTVFCTLDRRQAGHGKSGGHCGCSVGQWHNP